MGFYAPSQLVQSAVKNGVTVRPVDINASDWDSSLEDGEEGKPALRLGLRMVKGLTEEAGEAIVCERRFALFDSVESAAYRSGIDRRALRALASAGAFKSLAGHRHRASWVSEGVDTLPGLLRDAAAKEATPLLSRPTEGQNLVADYRSTGLTLGRHPIALLRSKLVAKGYCSSADLDQRRNNRSVYVAGLVITKQRPGSASGVTFVTLEDEVGQMNLVIWEATAIKQRKELLNARLMGARGKLQIESGVTHIIVQKIFDLTHMLGELTVRSRDFH